MIICYSNCYSVVSDSVTPWTDPCQACLSLTVFQSLLKFMFILVMPSNPSHSLSLASLALRPSFPASGSFPMCWLFTWGGQIIGASASVLPMSIQGWFLLGWTVLISLLFKGLSRVFSSPQSISSSALCLFYGPALTCVHDYWKDHSFDYSALCHVSAF